MTTPYTHIPNTFRQALQADRTLLGCWVSLGSPVSTEVMGLAGFDWLLLDAEHAPNDVLTLIPQLMALKDSPSAPVVRPPWNDAVLMKRLLDGGFVNFLIPMVDTAQQARDAVAATRYPPQGIRGVSVSQRGNRYGALADYFKVANDHVTVLVQIETRAAVAAAAEIAAVDGVDGVFIGPSDLAATHGHLGNPGHPDIDRLIFEAGARLAKAGKPAGFLTPNQELARRTIDAGFLFVAVGSDSGLMVKAADTLAKTFKG